MPFFIFSSSMKGLAPPQTCQQIVIRGEKLREDWIGREGNGDEDTSEMRKGEERKEGEWRKWKE